MTSSIPLVPGPIEQAELAAYAPLSETAPAGYDVPNPMKRLLLNKRKPYLLVQEGLYGSQVLWKPSPRVTEATWRDGTSLYDDPHNFVQSQPKQSHAESMKMRGLAGTEPQDVLRFTPLNAYQVGTDGFGSGWQKSVEPGFTTAHAAAYTRAKKVVGEKWLAKLHYVAATQPDLLGEIASVEDLLSLCPDVFNSTPLHQGQPSATQRNEDFPLPRLNEKRAQRFKGGYAEDLTRQANAAGLQTKEQMEKTQKKKDNDELHAYLPWVAGGAVAIYLVVNHQVGM